MNILFYKNQKLPTPWAYNYKELYKKAFKEKGYNVKEIDETINESGLLVLCHKVELERFKKEPKNPKIKTTLQSNGTSANFFIYNVDEKEELEDLKYVDFNLTAYEKHTEALKEKFKINNVYTIGFPIQYDNIKHEPIKGRYIIAGRLTPDKNIYTSIDLALYDGAKEIIVCFPENNECLLKYYPKKENIFYKKCNEVEFLNELKQCEKYVITSYGDVFSVTDVQARRMGLEVLNINHFTKQDIPYYQNNGEILKMYDIETCINNLIKLINENI